MSVPEKEEKLREKPPDKQDCKDLWQDDDDLLSQAYDHYLTQSESILVKNMPLSPMPKEDTAPANESSKGTLKSIEECDRGTSMDLDFGNDPTLTKSITANTMPKRDTAPANESSKGTLKSIEECDRGTSMDLDFGNDPTLTKSITANTMPKRDTAPANESSKGTLKSIEECDRESTSMDLDFQNVPTLKSLVLKSIDSNTMPRRDNDNDTLKPKKKKAKLSSLKNTNSTPTTSHGLDKSEQIEESEDESLFGGDFSDDDPTYLPDGPPKYSPLESDSSDDLIQLDELLNPEIHYEKPKQPVDDVNNNESTYVAQSITSEIFKLSWKIIKPRSRWSQNDPATWKKNVIKRRRAEGLPYETKGKCRAPKVPKKIDCSKCKFQCNHYIAEETRKELCRKYWALDFVGKKQFILAHLDIKHTKRVLLNRTRQTRRSYTKQCFFNIKEEKINVCQDFFCRTLSISKNVISDTIKQRDSFGQYSKENDPRGRREPKNKTSIEAVEDVKQHIASFPSMESHYVRKKLKRKYLDAGLTLSKMYSLYVDECKKKNTTPAVSEMTYRRIFSTEFNLGFFMPKKDQCLLCTKFNRANGEERENLKNEYRDHIKRKETCNREKENDKKRAEENTKFLSVSFDLQAILQIPSTDVGLLYYTRKLTVYNLTIYENKLPNEAYCFVWNEVNGKKGSAEIGTILYHYLTSCVPKDVTEVSLFSDTCGGQNRNQYVVAILLWLMMQEDMHINIIEHKFLESGHSYMEADSMHSAIETAKKNCDVYCMSDWINIFKRARSKKIYKKENKKVKKSQYHVKEFKYHEFKDLKSLGEAVINNRTKNTDGERVNWLKIKRIKYVKGDPKLYYNYDMSNNFMIMDVTNGTSTTTNSRREVVASATTPTHGYSTRRNKQRQQQRNEAESTMPLVRDRTEDRVFPPLQQLYHGPLPISVAKKKDLVNLCDKGVIPEEYHGWFKSLPTEADQVDRLPAATESDDEEESSGEA